MKNELKIRRLLGSAYHLSVSYSYNCNKEEVTSWRLYRVYDDSCVYLSKDNKVIMSSENNTEEELLDFAKTHHKYNYSMIFSSYRVVISWFLSILMFANILCFNSNEIITFACLSVGFYIIIECFIDFIILEHNNKVRRLELTENWKRAMENYENEK
jgi:hypothetical protein